MSLMPKFLQYNPQPDAEMPLTAKALQENKKITWYRTWLTVGMLGGFPWLFGAEAGGRGLVMLACIYLFFCFRMVSRERNFLFASLQLSELCAEQTELMLDWSKNCPEVRNYVRAVNLQKRDFFVVDFVECERLHKKYKQRQAQEMHLQAKNSLASI